MTRYADAKGRWGWMLYDWASQPYHTLIITFIFAPYFASAVAPTPAAGQEMWGWAASAGGLAIALMAPFLGAIADVTGPRKPWIALFSVFYMLGAFMLWRAAPGSDPTTALVWFVIGLIGVEFTTVFTNAMMPDLVPRRDLGRLSGSGWALGYVGGLATLILMLALFAEDAQTGKTLIGLDPILGLDPAAREGTRAVGPLSAIWYAVFILPLFLFTPDAPRQAGVKGAMARGLKQLGAALADLKRRASLRWFLIASMLYRDALNGFYIFGGIYAAGVLGWSIVQIGVFGIIAAAVGAVGAWIGGRADARFGPKPVVSACILLLIVGSLGAVSASRDSILFALPVGEGSSAPDILFYCVGGLIGAAGGAVQAASRTLLVHQSDHGRVASSFGLYALAGKATAFLAPAMVAAATAATDSQRIGVAPVILLFVLGLACLIPVRDTGGEPA